MSYPKINYHIIGGSCVTLWGLYKIGFFHTIYEDVCPKSKQDVIDALFKPTIKYNPEMTFVIIWTCGVGFAMHLCHSQTSL